MRVHVRASKKSWGNEAGCRCERHHVGPHRGFETPKTHRYVVDRYGDEIVEDVLDVWERVEAGEIMYREASATLGMEHADFLRVAVELELFDR